MKLKAYLGEQITNDLHDDVITHTVVLVLPKLSTEELTALLHASPQGEIEVRLGE